MDPVTIVTGCVSILGTIAKLSTLISGFVRNFRDARTDLDLVRLDLTSLSSVLELVEGDVKEYGQKALPDTLAKKIHGIVQNCDAVLSKIIEVLEESGGMMDGIKWAMGKKEKVLDLKASLGAHKTSLELALQLMQLNLAQEIKNNTYLIMSDTQEIRDVTGIIAQDTCATRVDIGVLLKRLASLQSQVAQLNKQTRGGKENVILERYLDDMTSYAETVNGDIQDTATSQASLEIVAESKGEPLAVGDEDGDKEIMEKVQAPSLEDAKNAQTVSLGDSTSQSLHHGLDIVSQHPKPEIHGLNIVPDQKLGEGPQSESPWPLHNSNNQSSSCSLERLSSPEGPIPSTPNSITNPSPPNQVLREMTISQSSNLNVEIIGGGNAPQASPQSENEKGKTAFISSKAINVLPIRRPLPISTQESLKTTQEDLGTRKTIFSYFSREKQRATTTPTPTPTPSSFSNVVGIHYHVGTKIGERSNSVVFKGANLLNDQPVAIIFEPRKSDAPRLRDEYRTHKILAGCPGIPKSYYFGQEGLHNILITDLLGPSLEDLFDHCYQHFSIKTVVMVAKQMLSRVQTIHERDWIHCRIMPDNFLIGRPGTKAANVIHVIEFGRAKQYRDPKTKGHISYRERKSVSGIARYMSINAHLGREQSRRDDLEALGYVFIYFLGGRLPWQGLKATKKQDLEKIRKKKEATLIKDLCKGFPDEFNKYLSYVRNLGFEDQPDYNYLQDLFTRALKNTGEIEDGIYDWMMINDGKGWETSK